MLKRLHNFNQFSAKTANNGSACFLQNSRVWSGRQIVTHENLIFDADIKENLPLATGGLITTSNSPNLSTWPHLQN